MPHLPQLGRFLADRRARLRPHDVGLSATGQRRVPGLRREEVALLAGVSVEYYTRLEQARTGTPSRAVLAGLAGALRLDPAETRHLCDLAGARSDPLDADGAAAGPVRPQLRDLVLSLRELPAMVLSYRFDVLVCNRLAARLFDGFDEPKVARRNLARYLFLVPEARRRYVDWDELAHQTGAQLRMALAAHGGDGRLRRLVAELRAGSDAFGRAWDSGDVHERTNGRKRLWHPDVGHLVLHYENFPVPGSAGERLLTMHAAPGSAAADALTLLAIDDASDSSAPTPAPLPKGPS